jgi:hypothetical protein
VTNFTSGFGTHCARSISLTRKEYHLPLPSKFGGDFSRDIYFKSLFNYIHSPGNIAPRGGVFSEMPSLCETRQI